MKKIEKKVKRYLELSIKFSKSQEDVFGKHDSIKELISKDINAGTIISYGSLSDTSYGYVYNSTDAKVVTLKDEYKEATKQLLLLVDEWEEYKELKNLLSDYFFAKNKVEKKLNHNKNK